MSRSARVRLVIEGELARALAWAAESRGVQAQALARELVGSAGAELLAEWKQRNKRTPPGIKPPTRKEAQALEAVLQKAYGPRGKDGPSRASRPGRLRLIQSPQA